MERLTDKNHNAINKCSEYSSCYSCHKENCYIKEIEEKLGELEDVLESWHIENLEELKTRLHDCQVYRLENNSNETLIHNLKNELAELKQKAIVPKFSLGQEVWAISVYRKDCVDNFIIQEICFCSRYGLYYKTNMGINLYEYYFDIFATQEEAEQKLAEIGGKDE